MIRTLTQLWELLNTRERAHALTLLVTMFVLGLVEIASVASIFPLIAVISNPRIVSTNLYLRWAYEALRFSDNAAFLIFLSAGVFAAVIVRTALSTINSYAILRFASGRSHSFSVRLMTTYLGRNYDWFLARNSSDFGKAMLSEAEEVVSNALLPALLMTSQAIVGGCIIALIAVADPVVGVVAALSVGTAYTTIYTVIRRQVKELGRVAYAANQQRFRIAQEVFGGIKEVKVGGLERGYLRQFEKTSLRLARSRSTLQVIGELPRHLLEALAVGGMLIVIMTLLIRNQGNLGSSLPIVALYAFAGLRLIPVVQVLYRSFVSLRSSRPYVEALHAGLSEPTKSVFRTRPEPFHFKNSIQLRGVGYTYPNASRPALKDVDLIIPVNGKVAFVGKTGAGKTSVVDVILGLLEPQLGSLFVDDIEIDSSNVRSWQASIGYVPQHIFLADDTVAANIAFGVAAGDIDMQAVRLAARKANLDHFVEQELPQSYQTEVGERGIRLSGGQRQRIGIARALYHDPDVLVMDEATSALDNLTEQIVMDAIANLAAQKTIIMIAHRLTTIKNCDPIYVMGAGGVVARGTFEELIELSPIFREMAAANE